MPVAAANSAPAKDLLPLSDTHTNFLQHIEGSDYIIWYQRPDDANADSDTEAWRHALSRDQ